MKKEPDFREVEEANGKKCIVLQKHDEIYNAFKKPYTPIPQYKHLYLKEGDSIQIERTGVDKPRSGETNLTNCFLAYMMQFKGTCENDECSNISGCHGFNRCFCERTEMQSQENITVDCACQLTIPKGYCPEATSEQMIYEKKEKCLIKDFTKDGTINIVKCTIKNHNFPSEYPYFNTPSGLNTTITRNESMVRLTSNSDLLKNTLAMNPLVPFLLLIFHLLLYFRHICNITNDINKIAGQ